MSSLNSFITEKSKLEKRKNGHGNNFEAKNDLFVVSGVYIINGIPLMKNGETQLVGDSIPSRGYSKILTDIYDQGDDMGFKTKLLVKRLYEKEMKRYNIKQCQLNMIACLMYGA
ncbi:unnamed protein product [Gordionus sp. m RMFG-2023]